MSAQLDLGTLVAHLDLDIERLRPSAREGTQLLGNVQQAASAVGENLSLDKAIAGLGRLGQESKRAQQLLDGPAEQLEHIARVTGKSVDEIRADLKGMVESAKKAGVGIEQVGDEADQTGTRLQRLAAKVGQLSPAMGGALEKLGDKAKLLGAATGTFLGAGLVGAINAEPAKKKLVAQLALNPAEQQRIGASAKNLFKGNYGEDLGEVNEAIRSVVQNISGMRDASQADLQSITGQVLSLASTFDQDLGGVTRAVGQTLRTGLASSAQEALDILTAGFQAGNDKAEDLLDTMNEYGTQFRKAGIDGKTAMGLISQGLQAGARDADIVADVVKEMSIRLQDGSALVGLNQLGLNGSAIIEQFKKGGPEAAAALDQVIDKIRDTDAVTQNLAAVQLVAGTQAEDLGAAFNGLDLSKAAGQMGDVADRAKDVDTATGSSLQGSLTSLGRTLSGVAVDAGETLLPALSGIVSTGADVLGVVLGLVRGFGDLPTPVQGVALGLGALGLAKVTGLVGGLKSAVGSLLSPLASMRMQLAANADLAAANGARFPKMAAGLGAVKRLAGSIGPAGLAIAGVVTAVTLFGKSNEASEQRVQAHADAVARLKDQVDGATGSFKASATSQYASMFADMDADLQKVGVSVGDATTLIIKGAEDGGASWEKLRGLIANGLDTKGVIASSSFIEGAVEEMAKTTGRSQQDVVASIAAGGQRTADLIADLTAKGGLSAKEYGDYIDDTRGRIEEYAPVVAKVRQEVDAATDGQRAAIAAHQAEQQALDNARQAQEQKTESAREDAAANRDNADAAAAAGEAHREEAAASRGAAFDNDAYSAAVGRAAAATRDTGDAEAEAATHKEQLADRQEILNGRYEQAQAAAEAAGEALTPFEEASQDAADAQSELADQAGRVSDALDRQAGRLPSLEEANAKAAATGDDLAESFKVGTDEAERLGSAILNADGSVKTADEGGRKFRQGILDTRQAMVDQAAAAYAQSVATGDVAGASKAAEEAQRSTYDQFIQTATAILGSKDAAERAAAAYGLVPSEIATTIKADDQASAKVAAAKRAAEDYAARQYSASLGLDTSVFDARLAAAKQRATALGVDMTLRTGPLQAKADGGAIVGPGTGTSDSVLMWGSNGEHMVPADEVQMVGGQAGMYRLRAALRAGNLPKFAGGGGIGRHALQNLPRYAAGGSVNVGALAGNSPRSAGSVEGVTLGGLGELFDQLKELRSNATDTAKALAAANSELAETKTSTKAAIDSAFQEYAKATRDRERAEALTLRKQGDRDRQKAKLDALQERLTGTRDQKARAALQKEVSAASSEYERRRKAAASASAAEKKAASEAIKARGEYLKTRTDETAKLRAATQAQTRAQKASDAAASAKAEYEGDYQRTATARRLLVQLSRETDQYNTKLADQKDVLQNLRQQRAQIVSSVASGITGFGGGILGSPDTRRTGGDILRGLQSNLAAGQKFSGNLARLQKLGLSPALLQQIAEAGVEGGGQTAAALAGADAATIRRINATVAQTNALAAKTGASVGDAVLGKQIALQTSRIELTNRHLAYIASAQKGLASAIGYEITDRIGTIGPDRLAVIVEKVQNGRKRR